MYVYHTKVWTINTSTSLPLATLHTSYTLPLRVCTVRGSQASHCILLPLLTWASQISGSCVNCLAIVHVRSKKGQMSPTYIDLLMFQICAYFEVKSIPKIQIILHHLVLIRTGSDTLHFKHAQAALFFTCTATSTDKQVIKIS